MKTNRNEMPGVAVFSSTSRRISVAMAMALAMTALSGCAGHTTRPPPSMSGASQMVDNQMDQTISSVDRSLKLLVQLDRGDEGARKDGFIGDTVAGARAPNKSAPAMPSHAQPQTRLGQEQERARISYNRLALKARMNAQWDGSASDLLRQVASTVHYRYQEVGAATLPDIHIKQGDSSVETVLQVTADQIKPAGSIRVLTGPRVICLVRSTSSTAVCPAAFVR